MRELARCKKIFLFILCAFFVNPLFGKGISKSMLVSMSVPLIGGIYSATLNDVEGIKELAYGCAFTAHLTTLTKYSVRRNRPNGDNNLSFPSGHASASFMGASYLHHRYGLRWGVPMYLISAAISVQRVNVRDHYWTDIIAGAALGYLAGYLFTAKYPNVWVAPSVSPQTKSYGLQLNMSW